MGRTVLFVGGREDGSVLDVPAEATAALTPAKYGAVSWYQVDPAGRAFFVGFDQIGQAMVEIPRRTDEHDERDRQALEEASKPRGCRSCGATYADAASYAVHRDPDWPGGCLPGDALGQLAQVDGVWCRI